MSSLFIKRFAIVKNEKIDNVIVANDDFVNKHFENYFELSEGQRCAPGWSYIDGQIIEPIAETVEETSGETL